MTPASRPIKITFAEMRVRGAEVRPALSRIIRCSQSSVTPQRPAATKLLRAIIRSTLPACEASRCLSQQIGQFARSTLNRPVDARLIRNRLHVPSVKGVDGYVETMTGDRTKLHIQHHGIE